MGWEDASGHVGTPDRNGEEDFVRRLASGDPEARHRLGTHYAGLLRAIARNRAPGRSSSFLDDVVSETLVRVLTAIQNAIKIRDRAHFAAYCIGVCQRVVHELKRKDGHTLPGDESGSDRAAPDNPELTVVRRQEIEAADEALATLPSRDRSLFEQVFLQEEDKDEVCRRFGITREHLRVLLHRARERFSVALERRRATRKVS